MTSSVEVHHHKSKLPRFNTLRAVHPCCPSRSARPPSPHQRVEQPAARPCRRHRWQYRSMFLFDRSAKTRMVTPDEALPGRDTRPFGLAGIHTVLGTPVEAPVPTGHAEIAFGMGCFWGAERVFWQLPGVWTTAAGYAGGY